MNGRSLRTSIFVLFVCLFASGVSFAQSVITGVVKDSSGGVLPGVTVEVSSPVLIEKSRSAVTDNEGLYRIVDLRAGTYAVTFTLAGFNSVKMEGLELPAIFTATVNTDMKVGTLEEAVTVTGSAPLVDVQSVVTQTVLPQKLLEEIPTGRSMWAVGQVIPGVTARRGTTGQRDVGGTQGANQSNITAHGSTNQDGTQLVDGMRINSLEADGGVKTYINPGGFSEFSYATSGIEAQYSGGGVRLNMIPKDGGNTFRGEVFTSFANDSLQAEPLTDELKSQGLIAADQMQRLYDLNVSVGGPIKKDRLWFFGSYRRSKGDLPVANSFYTDTSVPNINTWKPDLTQQVVEDNSIQSGTARLLYQVNSKNKISGYYERPAKFRGHEASGAGALRARESFYHRGGFSPEETGGIYQTSGMYYIGQVKWTGAWTNRMLFEGGFLSTNQSPPTGSLLPDLAEGISKGVIPVSKFDIRTTNRWGAPSEPFTNRVTIRRTALATLSYVTGSHALKGGVEWGSGYMVRQYSFEAPGVNYIEQYANGVPTSIIIHNTPVDAKDDLHYDIGVFLQDSWTFKRATISPGIRFEAIKSGYPDQAVPLSQQTLTLLEGYAPRPLFPSRTDLPNWRNWSPRLGVAYDLFGNGRTALRMSINRYQASQSIGISQRYNPMRLETETRTWTDSNGNLKYDPGVDVLGPTSNANFGQVFRVPDPELRRPYNTELAFSVQHEIIPGLAANVGYYRRAYGNLEYSENPALYNVPGAFTPVTVANPCNVHPEWKCPGAILPTVTVYSINPALQGQGSVIDRNSKTNTNVYNGFEAAATLRKKKLTALVSVTYDRTVSQLCEPFAASFAAASNPNNALLCDQTLYDIPYQTQFKLAGSYELPYQLWLSGTVQSNPSPLTNVTYTFTRTEIPTLTQASVTATLLEPGSFALEQHNQMDLRLARSFKFGKTKLDLQVDLFNVFNTRTIDAMVLTAGPTLLTPTQVLQPRFMAFGAQLHF